MKKQYREMINTRMVYRMESEMYAEKVFNHLTKQRSLTMLKRLATFIWKKEGFKHDMPEIRFGKGVYHCGTHTSWCDGDVIELVKKQQDVLTLIHELVHAAGFDYHNFEFMVVELDWLMRYTPVNHELLIETFKPILLKSK